MKIIYRISDSGYNKVKPDYINNESCLANAVKVFDNCEWSIIADNISEETNDMIQKYKSRNHINYTSIGHGAGTFNLALDEALQYDEDEIVYFIENDYLHKPNPFPYDDVWDVITSGDTVDKISSLIVQLIKEGATGIFNVGTGRKKLSNIAPGKTVIPKPNHVPFDTSMNLSKLNLFLNKENNI